MKKIFLRLDPHQQSFLFFKYSKFILLVMAGLSVWMTLHWKSNSMDLLFNNIFLYAPNYLTHEMLGHNLVGNLFYRLCLSFSPELGQWIHTLAGNGVETLVPLGLLIFLLRLDGGRWAFPPVLYWLASTFYGAGVYAQDARACSLPLTSSDMLTNYKPGEICGDWHHILEPLGWLNYDQWIAYTFIFIGSILFLIAVYSAWYYWTHPDDYMLHKQANIPVSVEPENDWTPPHIYNTASREDDFPGDRNP